MNKQYEKKFYGEKLDLNMLQTERFEGEESYRLNRQNEIYAIERKDGKKL